MMKKSEHPCSNSSYLLASSTLQGDRMDKEAIKCQVLTVSNHSCESLTLKENTLECTVPTQLRATTAKELQVEVRRHAGTTRRLGSSRTSAPPLVRQSVNKCALITAG